MDVVVQVTRAVAEVFERNATEIAKTVAAEYPGAGEGYATGRTKKSVRSGVKRHKSGALFGFVSVNTGQGMLREIGTYKQPARPILVPAMTRQLEKIQRELEGCADGNT